MNALYSFLLTDSTEYAIAVQEKEVPKRTSDDLMGLLACGKSKNSRRTFYALLYKVTESLLGVAPIY